MKDQVDALDSIGYPAATIHGGLSPQRPTKELTRNLQQREPSFTISLPQNGFLIQILWTHFHSCQFSDLLSTKHIASANGATTSVPSTVNFQLCENTSLRQVSMPTPPPPHLMLEKILQSNCISKNQRFLLARSTDRTLPTVSFNVLTRIAQILEILGRHPKEASIIYCISRRETERLAKHLTAAGLLAHPYHAGLDAKKRHKTQEAFAKETLDVVVATVAFGMGIDRSNVRLVLHTGLPKSLEAYQQETGRAGRDGLAAECVLLYSPADVFSWEALIRRGAESSELTEDESQILIDSQILHLQRMRQYAQAARCRHAFLSEHFGQSYKLSNCKNCDICLGETTNLADSTTVAQKIISCVARIEERFGVRHLCEVLRGAKTEAVQRNGHHHLSTYGLLKSFDQRMCENLVHQLLDQEYLSRSQSDRPVVMLNQKSWEILRSQRTVTLLEPRLKKAVRSRKEPDDWNGVDRQLFDHLRQWRRKIADGRGKPAWTILDDRALRSIAREKPDTLATLLQCKGIGEKRLADHGTAILELIKQCDCESA